MCASGSGTWCSSAHPERFHLIGADSVSRITWQMCENRCGKDCHFLLLAGRPDKRWILNRKLLGECGIRMRGMGQWEEFCSRLGCFFVSSMKLSDWEGRALFCWLFFSSSQDLASPDGAHTSSVTFIALCSHGKPAPFHMRSCWPSYSIVLLVVFPDWHTNSRNCIHVWSFDGHLISPISSFFSNLYALSKVAFNITKPTSIF
jgi:hypothetical protein